MFVLDKNIVPELGTARTSPGMTVVSRNVGDFEHFPGLAVINPWTES